MGIREQVAEVLMEADIMHHSRDTADRIIPLVKADTLRAISKESKRMDGTIYLVPDYTKFREAIKEAGIEE